MPIQFSQMGSLLTLCKTCASLPILHIHSVGAGVVGQGQLPDVWPTIQRVRVMRSRDPIEFGTLSLQEWNVLNLAFRIGGSAVSTSTLWWATLGRLLVRSPGAGVKDFLSNKKNLHQGLGYIWLRGRPCTSLWIPGMRTTQSLQY